VASTSASSPTAIAVEPYLREENPLPLGSIVIKEEYPAGSNCLNDSDLVRWRVMRKEAPGFDPEDGDWHWQWVTRRRARALRRQGHLHQLPRAA
jgi:hypothetical protein